MEKDIKEALIRLHTKVFNLEDKIELLIDKHGQLDKLEEQRLATKEQANEMTAKTIYSH